MRWMIKGTEDGEREEGLKNWVAILFFAECHLRVMNSIASESERGLDDVANLQPSLNWSKTVQNLLFS